MHFTYESRDASNDLRQGDVLRPTPELLAALKDIHPHFADQNDYPLFMVLTQTCDLVQRGNQCKSHYITLCAVRPFFRALEREILKQQRSETLRRHSILNLERRSLVREAVERFINNTRSGYFYLYTTEEIPEPMCAFLAVSIAMRASEHYEKCKESRIIGLTPEFQAKVGWLLGEMYARVATKDWTDQSDFSESTYDEMIGGILDQNFRWLDKIKNKDLSQAIKDGKVDPSDNDAFYSFIDGLPGKKERILNVIRVALVEQVGMTEGPELAKTIDAVSRDKKFLKLFESLNTTEEESGLDTTSPS